MLRILLVDDHEAIRRGLRSLIEFKHAYWEVCGEAGNGHEAVALALQLQPDIVVLDVMMPGLGGMDATRQIRRLLPKIGILIYSMLEDEQTVGEAVSAGADGFVAKSQNGHQVLAAIEAIALPQPYFCGTAGQATPSSFLWANGHSPRTQPPMDGKLTRRQCEVVKLIAQGMTNRQIAATLTISDKTAKTHRAAIMRRLDVNTVAEVVLYAVRSGLIAPFVTP